MMSYEEVAQERIVQLSRAVDSLVKLAQRPRDGEDPKVVAEFIDCMPAFVSILQRSAKNS